MFYPFLILLIVFWKTYICSCFEQISGQLKSLQIVASLTAERDGEIRKAALNALATGYKILGVSYCDVPGLCHTLCIG